MSVNDIEEDILELPDPEAPVAQEMVPLFRMGGDVYEMPKKVPAGVALEFLEKQAEEGPDAASMWIMVEILGEDTYTMLKEHPGLEFEDINKIFERLEKHVLGGKDPKKPQRGVRRRPGSKKSRGS